MHNDLACLGRTVNITQYAAAVCPFCRHIRQCDDDSGNYHAEKHPNIATCVDVISATSATACASSINRALRVIIVKSSNINSTYIYICKWKWHGDTVGYVFVVVVVRQAADAALQLTTRHSGCMFCLITVWLDGCRATNAFLIHISANECSLHIYCMCV